LPNPAPQLPQTQLPQNQLPQQQQIPQAPDLISTIKSVSEKLYPSVPERDAYQSPFSNEMRDTLGSILGYQRQQYNPDEDIALKQAQDQAIAQTMRQAARRNMLYSEGTKTRSQQAAQGLIPAYQDRFEDLQQRDFDNLRSTFGLLGTADDRAYRQYLGEGDRTQQSYQNRMDALRQATGVAGDVMARQERQAELGAEEGEDLRERYKNMFGRYLSDREIGYAEAYANASSPMLDYLDEHKADYQAEINRLEGMGLPEDNPYIQALHGARMHKIQNDFEMGMAYGRDYGLEPAQKEQKEYFDATMKELESEIQAITAENKILGSYLDIEQLKADIYDTEIGTEEKMRRIAEMGERLELAKRQVEDKERQTDIRAYTAETSAATAASREARLANEASRKAALDEAQKKSAYLSTVIGSIDKTIEDLGERDYGDGTLADRVTMPGTVENKRVVDLINQSLLGGLITRDEAELLYNSYGIPIPD